MAKNKLFALILSSLLTYLQFFLLVSPAKATIGFDAICNITDFEFRGQLVDGNISQSFIVQSDRFVSVNVYVGDDLNDGDSYTGTVTVTLLSSRN